MRLFKLGIFLLLAYQAMTQSSVADYYFSHEIERLMANDSLRPSSASRYYSYIGDYHNTMINSDLPVSWGLDTVDLTMYETAPALEHIVKLAKSKKIVIISESHSRPQHRVFAKRLIEELAKYDYKTLFVETLSVKENASGRIVILDSLLNSRGYVLDSQFTGTYSREPEFSSMIRTALSSNYEVKAYEHIRRKKGLDRDVAQAYNVIEQWEGEKVVIYCGWWHAIESQDLKRNRNHWMARILKDSLGIDPLTIYQDNFTEKIIYDSHPLLGSVQASRASVFLDEGKIVPISDHVDVEVIHPRTKYKEGRPDWLYENGRRVSYKVDISDLDLDFPILVKAFVPGEEDGVAVDAIELKNNYDKKVLVLAPGHYKVRFENKKESQTTSIIVE